MSASPTIIGYSEGGDHPWPRVFQLVGVVTLIYAAAMMVSTIYEAPLLWPLRRVPAIPASGPMYLLWFIHSIIQVLICVLVIVGAIRLLQRGSRRLILAGHWTLIISWSIAFSIGTFLRADSERWSMTFSSIVYGAQ